MWCHALLSMPILGLGLFFVLPFPWALGIYLALVLISFLLYYKIMESMRVPVQTGVEALIGKTVRTDTTGIVHWKGEWWTAEPIFRNRSVRVIGLRGLRLLVMPVTEKPKNSYGDQRAKLVV